MLYPLSYGRDSHFFETLARWQGRRNRPPGRTQ
jgi:hypothetical protein